MTTMVSATMPNIQVFTEEPGRSFSGLVPATLCGFTTLDNGAIAATFKLLNSITFASESITLNSIIEKSEILSCINYDHGTITTISIHEGWARIFKQKGVSEVLLSPGRSDGFKLVEEVFDIEPMSDETYKTICKRCAPLLKV